MTANPRIFALRSRWRTKMRFNSDSAELHEIEYTTPLDLPEHHHPWPSVHFVLSGKVYEQYGDRYRVASAGESLFYAAGVVHVTRLSPGPTRLIHAPIRGRAAPPADKSSHWKPRGADLTVFMLRALAAARTTDSAHMNNTLSDIVHAATYTPPPVVPETIARTAEGLRSNPNDTAPFPGNRGHLRRRFREVFGVNMTTYRRRCQVANLTKLLLSTDESLSSLALRCAFADQSHMCRIVRRETGMSPREIRLLARQSTALSPH